MDDIYVNYVQLVFTLLNLTLCLYFVFQFYAECLEVNSLLDVTQIRAILKDGVKRLKEESIKATDDKEKELIEVLDGNASN